MPSIIPLRILHVIPSLSVRRGGPSFVARALAAGLVRAGAHVTLVTTDDDGPGRADLPLGRPVPEQGVICWYFPRQLRFYTVSWPLAVWLWRHVGDYDVVHIHALFSFASLAAALAARLRGLPYVVRPLGTLARYGMTRRRPWLKRLSFALLERHALAGAAAVHYTSAQERDEAVGLAVAHRAVVIPNPVDQPPLVAEKRPGRDELSILFLSRIDPKKGLDLLLPAFAALLRRAPSARLVIAGDGEPAYVAALRREAARLGLDDRVRWAGFLDGEARRAAYAAADLFVLPSYAENFGNVVVEAMAHGLPVVITDQVGLHAEVAAAGAGLVVPCDVERLATALALLMGDAALRARLGAAGAALAGRRYAPELVSARLLALYEELATAACAPSPSSAPRQDSR